jgi:hypothetical protein
MLPYRYNFYHTFSYIISLTDSHFKLTVSRDFELRVCFLMWFDRSQVATTSGACSFFLFDFRFLVIFILFSRLIVASLLSELSAYLVTVPVRRLQVR